MKEHSLAIERVKAKVEITQQDFDFGEEIDKQLRAINGKEESRGTGVFESAAKIADEDWVQE